MTTAPLHEAADPRAVLAARARALAAPVEARAEARSLHVVVVLGDQRLAVPASHARRVAGPRPLTPVPSTVEGVVGVVPVRGTIVAAVDLAVTLGIAAAKPILERELIVVDDDLDGVALLVDEVEGLVELDVPAVDETEPAGGGLTRAGPPGLRLLSVAAVLSRPGDDPMPATPEPPGGTS